MGAVIIPSDYVATAVNTENYRMCLLEQVAQVRSGNLRSFFKDLSACYVLRDYVDVSDFFLWTQYRNKTHFQKNTGVKGRGVFSEILYRFFLPFDCLENFRYYGLSLVT